MKHITAYGLDWHKNKSNAFQRFLIEPLKDYIEIDFVSWDTKILPATSNLPSNIQIFCQFPPPKELNNDFKTHIVWIPMWDNVCLLKQKWWNQIPRNWRVVAFSDQVARRAEKAGLYTLKVKYYPNPSSLSPANWEKGRILYYWNRTGLINKQFLKRMCELIKIDLLIFLSKTDPASEKSHFNLEHQLGFTEVVQIPALLPQGEYERVVEQANIVIAPRFVEGVGVTFLEQYARGCAIFSYDGPAMNEYITHKKDGYLFRTSLRSYILNYVMYANKLTERITYKFLKKPSNALNHPSNFQNWNEINDLPLQRMGSAAILNTKTGYSQWKNNIVKLANFISDW